MMCTSDLDDASTLVRLGRHTSLQIREGKARAQNLGSIAAVSRDALALAPRSQVENLGLG